MWSHVRALLWRRLPVRLRQRSVALAVACAANLVLVASLLLGMAPLLVLLAVAAPVAVAIAARPQRGVLLLVLLVPFDGLLLLAPLPAVAAGWKEALIIAVLAASALAAGRERAEGRTAAAGWPLAMAVLFGLAVLSAVLTARPQALLGLKIGFFYLLVPLVLWRCPLDRRERDQLVSVLVGTGIVTALYGLLQQLLGHAALNELGYEYNTVIRFSGPFLRSFSSFIQPFPFALFLMIVLLVAIPHALDQPERLRSKVILLSSPVLLAALAVTFVRAAWLGLGVGLLLLGISRYKVLLLGVPVALLFIVLLPTSVSTTALSTSSSNERLTTWEDNLAAIGDQPLGFGIGTGGAAVDVDEPAALDGPTLELPDNHYFKILYELGVLGLWFFCLALLAAHGAARRAARRATGDEVPLAWGVTAVVAAAAVASFTSNFFEIFPVDLLFWTLLAVVTFGRPVEAEAPLAAPRHLATSV